MKKRHSFSLTILVFLFFAYAFFASTTKYIAEFKLPEQFTFRSEKTGFLAETSSSNHTKVEPKVPTIAEVFERPHDFVNVFSASELTTVVATGDLIPSRITNAKVVASGDFNLPFQDTHGYTRTADLTITNLEAPLTKNCPVTNVGMIFCGDQRWAGGMKEAGIDVATLENNHIDNYYATGIDQTTQALTQNGIDFASSSKLLIKTVKGRKLGFLAYNGVGKKINRDNFSTKINESKSKVDILFVAIHWGKEYGSDPVPDPTLAPDNPVEIGRLAIDSGADVIIGNHPHWVQGFEIYKDKMINYSLGNYIFDQDWSGETQEGTLVRYTFQDKTLIDMEFIPITIEDQMRAKIASGEKRKQILNKIRTSAEKLTGG